MRCVQKVFNSGLCAIFLFVQWGCAFDSAQPTQDPTQLASLGLLEKVRMQAGTVRVVAPAIFPEAKLEMPPGGVLGGFEWGVKSGVKRGAGIGLLPGATMLDYPPPIILWPLSLLVAATGAIVGTVMGVVLMGPYGAVASEPQAKVQEAEETLKRAIATLQLQETLRDHVVKQIRQQTPDLSIVSTEKESTEGQQDLQDWLDAWALKYKHVTTFLELKVVSFGLERQGLGVNPPLTMFMQVEVKLTRLVDRALLFDNSFQYKSNPRSYSEWAEDSGQNFLEAINMAYRNLAEQIVFVLR